MKYNLLIVLWIIIFPTGLSAQKHIPIKVACSNEATAIPFTKLFAGPVHPTFQVGTEFLYKHGMHYEFYQTANLGYIFHNYLYQGFYINTGIGYDYVFEFDLKLKSNFELGYLHTFVTQDEYQLKYGVYVNGPDRGNSRLMPTLSLGVGYNLNLGKVNSSEVYLLYKSWVEYPYSPGFIPIMSHINFEIGYKFYLSFGNEK
jgi:hypothetical protein